MLDKPVLPTLEDARPAAPSGRRDVMFVEGQWHDTALYRRSALGRGQTIEGPAIIEQSDTTTVIPPGWRAVVHGSGDLIVERTGPEVK